MFGLSLTAISDAVGVALNDCAPLFDRARGEHSGGAMSGATLDEKSVENFPTNEENIARLPGSDCGFSGLQLTIADGSDQ